MIRYTKEQKEAALSQAQGDRYHQDPQRDRHFHSDAVQVACRSRRQDRTQGWPQKRSLQRISGSLLDDDAIANKINRLEESQNAALISEKTFN